MTPPETTYVKTGKTQQINKEAAIYRRLESLQFLGAPRFYGTKSVSDDIGKKQLLIEKMAQPLVDFAGTRNRKELDLLGDIPEEHLDKDDAPMRPLRVDDFFDIAYQLILILVYLHNVANIGHRDIKPENVCIDKEGFLCVIDYEYAVVIGDSVPDWCQRLGTQIYAPPEVVCGPADVETRLGGLPYDERCDVWSYGISLVEMWCGLDYGSTSAASKSFSQQQCYDRVAMLLPKRIPSPPLVSITTDAVSLVCKCLVQRWVDRPTSLEIAKSSVFNRHVSEQRRQELQHRFGVLHLMQASS